MARVSIATRLANLEPRLLPMPGCATCRGWSWVLLVGDDGPHRPERCPDCGRVVPGTLVVHLVGVAIATL